MKFKTPYNTKLFAKQIIGQYSPGGGVSLAIPDQALTVSEILARYASGLSYSGAKVPIYDGEDQFFPDLRKMDISERHQYLADAKENLEMLKEQFQIQKKIDADIRLAKEKDEQRDKAQSVEPVRRTLSSNQQQNDPEYNPNPGKNSSGGNRTNNP